MKRALLTLVTIASVAGIFTAVLRGPLVAAGDPTWPLGWLAWPIVGWLILDRRPGNRIGWACLMIGGLQAVSFVLLSRVLDVGDEIAAWLELAYTVLGVVPWLLVIWLLITFPTGEYEGRLERTLGRALMIVGAWALVAFVVSPAPLADTGLDNPLGQPSLSGFAAITSSTGFLLIVALGLLAIVSLLVRWRRSSGAERQQYRWFLLGGSTFVLMIAAGQVLPESSTPVLPWLLAGSAIPVSIGIAVARYRLYDIDRLLSRTVAYVLLIGLLGGVYLIGVTTLTSFLPAESPLAVAGSTLAVAALFNPVRKRIQAGVDRRFNRSRYDAEKVMDRFTGSLQGKVDAGEIVDGWVEVVATTMQPGAVGVWVKG